LYRHSLLLNPIHLVVNKICLKQYENDLFPCNNKSILMSIVLLFGINVCMESNKINLKLLNLGQISKKCFLSSNEPLQFAFFTKM
jgi:hypothetical protein